MQYVRVYADSAGQSHFGDVQIELSSANFAAPPPALYLSPTTPASGYCFVRAPAGWQRTRRPSHRRELYFCIAGEVESEVSDGEVRRFGPGSITLVEDTHGQGHASRALGGDGALFAVVDASG
jgi:hypothetical protein